MENIGFIGLGIMGKPMVKHLLAGGIPVMVHDIDPLSVAEIVSSGGVSGTLREIGKSCGIIFCMLPKGEVVEEILFQEDGAASELQPDSLVVDMSSVTPKESMECARRLEPCGATFMDCPVSGGEPKALDGTLTFMCGGAPADFARAKPYLDRMGTSSTLVGGVGSGSIAKLANQIIVNVTIAAVSEALVLASKAGVAPEKVYQAIRGGLAGSVVLDAKVPMILERNFQPGGKLSINHKDIHNVLQTAHEVDVPLPLSAQLFEIMQCLKVSGHMDEDHGGIVQYYESLADTVVERKGAEQ